MNKKDKQTFLGDYKWFKMFFILVNLFFLFSLCKNYYIINNTSKIYFELLEFNKYNHRHGYVSYAKLKINNIIYNFEVNAEFYDIYKDTGIIKFNVYYDFIFKKYITTADYYIARNFCLLFASFYSILLLRYYFKKYFPNAFD